MDDDEIAMAINAIRDGEPVSPAHLRRLLIEDFARHRLHASRWDVLLRLLKVIGWASPLVLTGAIAALQFLAN